MIGARNFFVRQKHARVRLRVRNIPFDLLMADLKVRPTKIRKAYIGLSAKRSELNDDVLFGDEVGDFCMVDEV